MIEKVEEFNKVIIGIDRSPGTIEDDTEFNFIIGSLLEEMTEWKEARESGDFVGELDALCDLIYFAFGGFARMGIPSVVANEIFNEVHNANMTKSQGKKVSRLKTHNLDAVKPEDFKGPEENIMKILSKHFGK